jgi:hypothetical protein
MRMIVFTAALLMVSQASAMTLPRPIVVWNCESADAVQKLGQVPALRTANKFDDATSIVNRLSSADRANRHARYTLALIAMDRAGKDPKAVAAALASLAALADGMPDYAQLSPQQRACAETPKLYTMFNTLGVSFTQVGDRTRAEHYFLRGETNETALPPDSRSKLNYNLGVFYTGQLNLNKASFYYSKARSPAAITQIQAIQKAQSFAAPVQTTVPSH